MFFHIFGFIWPAALVAAGSVAASGYRRGPAGKCRAKTQLRGSKHIIALHRNFCINSIGETRALRKALLPCLVLFHKRSPYHAQVEKQDDCLDR